MLNFPSFAKENRSDFSLRDLSSEGILPMKAAPAASKPVMDGVVRGSEYPAANRLDFSNGICLAYAEGKSVLGEKEDLPTNLQCFYQNIFCSYDEEAFYFAFELFFPESVPDPIRHNVLGEGYSFSFSISLNDSENPAVRFAYLTNTYFLSPDFSSCNGVSGIRLRPNLQGEIEIADRISSFLPQYLQRGITTSSGILCSGEYYKENAASSLCSLDKAALFTLEICLPAEDVLSCVSEEMRPSVTDALRHQKGSLCGSILTEFYWKDAAYGSFRIATGIPTETDCDAGDGVQTWKDFLQKQFALSESAAYAIEILPVPMYFVGSPEEKSEPSSAKGQAFLKESEPEAERPSEESETSVFQNKPVFSSEGEEISEDESIFDSLPDPDAELPEDILRVEISESESESEKEEKESKSVLASVLLVGCGVCLLGASFVCLAFLRKWEKREEKPKKSSKER